MAFGMYAASVPVYQRQLGAISKVLEKGSAWASAKKVDEAVIMGTRMIPDMLPFSRQVQIACRFAEESAARLAGAEVPKAPENAEKNLGELRARIAAVLEPPQGLQARADRRQRGPRDQPHDRWQSDEVHRRAVPDVHGPAELLFPLHDHLRNLASGRRGDRETGFPRRPLKLWTSAGIDALGLSAAMCITARQPGGPSKGPPFLFSPRGGWHAVPRSADLRRRAAGAGRIPVLPAQTDTRTRLTREIELGIPLISAAMDTVTEAPWRSRWRRPAASASSTATCDPEQQADEVRKVKKFEVGHGGQPGHDPSRRRPWPTRCA